MLFSSLEFIFRFLPIFLILYYIVPKRFQMLTLFLGSICFYAYGDYKHIPILFLTIVVNYLLAYRIEGAKRKNKEGTIWLVVGIIYNIGMLIFYKYINFVLDDISILLGGTIQFLKVPISMPLGISFITFTSISYIVDVYRRENVAKTKILNVATYVSMFPQVISGPIVRYKNISSQLTSPKYLSGGLENGFKIFTIGLGYKVILADQLAKLWNQLQVIGFDSISSPLAWLGLVGYSLQLYFDFNGYSLMAIGIGEMLGFNLPINFAHPYMSKTVSEFWRRWHITLGQWFKDYIYIPLGGNRKGVLRNILNLLIVWLFTGMWHGGSVNFLLWGLYLFTFVVIEKLFLHKFFDRHGWCGHIYLLVIIGISWMIFAITDIQELIIYLGRLFPVLSRNREVHIYSEDFLKYFKMYGGLIGVGAFLSTPIAMRLYLKYKENLASITILLVVFWYSVYLIVIGSGNRFMYFNF